MNPRLHRQSTVLAVVTHYLGESWLAQAIESLLYQTHPLDGIAVIDDASTEPPVEIVRRFPRVTLLTAAENVGPYRLIQAVIDCTHYDAYLQQDADDWSSPDRLAVLLAEAERTGAELLGTQCLNIWSCGAEEYQKQWSHPVDVNAAYLNRPEGWFLQWGTSIVTRDLVLRLGGLATGLRFAGDVEFTSRAHHVAKVVNVQHCCYYHRKRSDSLTAAPETGKGSPARTRVRSQIKARAIENVAAVAAGRAPDLAPLSLAEPITLRYLLGPALRGFPRENTR